MFIKDRFQFLEFVSEKILKTDDKYEFLCEKCGKPGFSYRHGKLNDLSFTCSKCKRIINHNKNKNDTNVIFVNNIEELKELRESKKLIFWKRYSFICNDCKKISYKAICKSVIDESNFLCHGCLSKRTYLKNLGVSNPMYLEITKQSIRKTCLEKDHCSWPTKTKRHRDKTRKTNLERYGCWPTATKEVKQKIERTCIEKYNYKTFAGSQKWRDQLSEISKKSSKRYIYNDICFDSAPEVALYIYLVDNKISFSYHPDVTFTYSFEGKTYSYRPDFKINNELWEIKGDHFFDKNGNLIDPFDSNNNDRCKCKQICMENNHVKILRLKDYHIYEKYVYDKYGSDYIQKMKQY